MFRRSPTWNLYQIPRRLAADVTRRNRLKEHRARTVPQREAVEMLTREDLARIQVETVRRTFPAETAEVVEEVVKARRGIWVGLNGRKFSHTHASLAELTG